jgi:hypothetical protein
VGRKQGKVGWLALNGREEKQAKGKNQAKLRYAALLDIFGICQSKN